MAAVDRMTEVSSWSTICSSEGDDSDRASVTRRGSLTLSEPASPTHATAMATHTIAKRVSLSPQGDKGHQGELLGPFTINPVSASEARGALESRSSTDTKGEARSSKNVVSRFVKNATQTIAGVAGIIGAPPAIVTGVLQLRLSFDAAGASLKIHIDKARGLKAKGSATNTVITNPYVKTYLKSKPRDSAWKRKTKIVQRTTDPVFAEDLTYRIDDPDDLTGECLLIEVIGSRQGKNEFLGQATVPVLEAVEHSQHGPIELRLLPHGDGAEWAPTSTKTNVLGSDTGTTAGSTASLDVRDLTPNPPPRILSQPYDQAYDTPSVGTAEKPGSLLATPRPSLLETRNGSAASSRRSSAGASSRHTSTTATSSSRHTSVSAGARPMLPLAGEKVDVRVALPMEDANGHDSDYGYFDPEDGVPRTTDGRPSSVPQPFLPLKLGPNLRNYSNSETSPLGSPADMSPLSMLTHAGGESGGIPGFLGAPGAGVQTSMSTLEMALSRPEASLVTGQSYVLNCKIEDGYDMPSLSGETRDRFFTVSAIVEGHKDKTQNLACASCDSQGRIPVDGEEWGTTLSVPFKLSANRKMPLVQIRLSHVRPHFKSEVGRATVALSTVPIYPNVAEAQTRCVDQLAVDMFMHKPKMKRLPPGLKQRNTVHVCHLKVKLWLTVLEQVIEDDAGDDDVELFDPGEIADMDDEIGDVPADLPEKMEWLLVDEVVNASLHKLNSLLFDEDSSFMQAFTAAKGYTEVGIGAWSDEARRDVVYTCPRSAIIKQYRATEKQEYKLKSSGAYVVFVRSLTPDAPYGSTFEVWLQFKLTPDMDKRNSRLEISAEMHWLSSPYMKRMIRNGAKDGLGSTYKLYVTELVKFINTRKSSSTDPMRSISSAGHRAQNDGGDNTSLGGVQTNKSVTFDDSHSLAAIPGVLGSGFSWEGIQSKVINMCQLVMLLFISYQLWQLNTHLAALVESAHQPNGYCPSDSGDGDGDGHFGSSGVAGGDAP